MDFLSWHFVFLLNLPIAGLVLVMLASLPRPLSMSQATPLPLDIYGSVLITLSLGLITYGLLEAQRGIFSPLEVVVLVAGAFLLAVFSAGNKDKKSDVAHVFDERQAVCVGIGANIGTVCRISIGDVFSSQLFIYPVFLAIPPFASRGGVSADFHYCLFFFISSRVTRLASTFGPRIILFFSSILMAVSLFWLSFADGDYFYSVMPGMVVMGFSVGLFAAPLTAVAMAAAGPGGMVWPAGVNNAYRA